MSKTSSMKERRVFVVWANTDTTEGKGWEEPIYACFSKTTADRMAIGKGVMGGKASVREEQAFHIDGQWYGPVHVYYPSKEDFVKDARERRREAALEKAKAAGLSDDDITNLVG